MVVLESLAIAVTLALVVFAYRVITEIAVLEEEIGGAEIVYLHEPVEPIELAG